MKIRKTNHSRIAGYIRAVPALIAAALALGGCAATHVGDTWQCPLAQGAACTTVADADPAVNTADKARGLAVPEAPDAEDAGGSGRACAGDCDPLGWLAKWIGTSDHLGEETAIAEPAPVSQGVEAPDPVSENLRTKERIARIWIAPFVDAHGVYREGHWVRAVLEPTRWRLR